MRELKVNGPRVLIRRITETRPTSELVEVVNYHNRPSLYGEVLSVGSGLRNKSGRRAIPVSVGDTVLLNQYSGTPVTIEEEDLEIVMEDDILAVIDD